jgi:hypothetical protein
MRVQLKLRSGTRRIRVPRWVGRSSLSADEWAQEAISTSKNRSQLVSQLLGSLVREDFYCIMEFHRHFRLTFC